MPTYDYKCKDCELIHEEFHRMSKKPRIKCPNCGGKCKKMISAGCYPIFKGPGFYETDYKVNQRIAKHIDKNPANTGDGSGRILGDNP